MPEKFGSLRDLVRVRRASFVSLIVNDQWLYMTNEIRQIANVMPIG
jgi:hypothetical protein